jgi:hypothetical protein
MKSFNRNSFIFPAPQILFLAIVLFFVFGWIVWPAIIESIITDWYPSGFPFTIHAVGLCPPPGDCIDFRWIALVLDIVLWYLISAVIFRARLRGITICVIFIFTVLGISLLSAN